MPANIFALDSPFKPTGDQPEAIAKLTQSFKAGHPYQTLVGVTGSGKTFTMANIIQALQRPALVICHNKTLAAQLYSEFKAFFPKNAVEYFISYYDYYQPEAYIPQTDTHIEKDASINQEIERFRLSTSASLLHRRDVIVVASVSCIYGLGSPEDFSELVVHLGVKERMPRNAFLEQLVKNQYERDDKNPKRGSFRVRGEMVEVYPADRKTCLRIEFWGDFVERIVELDPETGTIIGQPEQFAIYPANPYITSPDKLICALDGIRKELEERVDFLENNNRLIEAQRLRLRTEYDLQLMRELGFCSGIENYSRHLSGRAAGSKPWCLLDFFPEDYITFIDESHVTVSQIEAMYYGDRARKERLVDYGFRLPSALDNRPLRPDEFWGTTNQVLFVSATPKERELTLSKVVAEQLIRPTGLLDPIMEVYPVKGQLDHLIGEIEKTRSQGDRTLVTTLTKRMSEEVADHLHALGIRAEYLHSDIDAIERVDILRKLREGRFDVLIGVNLLREGLDLPEVALVAILDADKEGFLRSTTSIIQTAGRAARHEKGRVLLYADVITQSLQKAIETTQYRREKQMAYNQKHQITPKGVRRKAQESLHWGESNRDPISFKEANGDPDKAALIAQLETEMLAAADALQFEKAAVIQEQIERVQKGK